MMNTAESTIKTKLKSIFSFILIFLTAASLPTMISTLPNLNTASGSVALAGSCMLIFVFIKYPALPAYLKSKKPLKYIYGMLKTVFICGCLIAAVISGLIFGAMNDKTSDTDVTVIVMGCQVQGTQPSQVLKRRLDAAYAYLTQNPSAVCIVTGGMGSDEILPEAEVMRAYLTEKGISPDRIITESSAVSTETNLSLSAEIIIKNSLSRKVVIATDSFHQFRSHLYAKKNGLEPYSLNAETPLHFYAGYFAREILASAQALFLK